MSYSGFVDDTAQLCCELQWLPCHGRPDDLGVPRREPVFRKAECQQPIPVCNQHLHLSDSWHVQLSVASQDMSVINNAATHAYWWSARITGKHHTTPPPSRTGVLASSCFLAARLPGLVSHAPGTRSWRY